MSDQKDTVSDEEARQAVLRAIVKYADKAPNPSSVRDVAEAYALVTGSISSVDHATVKS